MRTGKRFGTAIKHLLLLVSALLVLGSQGATGLGRAGALSPTQTTAPAATQTAARITLTLPQADTELVVEGKIIPGTGTSRVFVTPPLETAVTHRYTFSATWQPNVYTAMTRSRTVALRAGEQVADTPVTSSQLRNARVAYDLVYNPIETRFLHEARNA